MYRAGRITGSRVHDVIAQRPSTNPANLTSRILGYTGHFTSKQTEWGIEKESEALQVYQQLMGSYHTNVKVKPTGLFISKSDPFVGASPDGLRSCDCHNDILVEVKCLPTLENQDPKGSFGDTNFCINVYGALKSTHRYYSQVQMQLYATDMDACDLVLYTGKAEHMYVTRVESNKQFQETMLSKCTLFFFNNIMPELLCRWIQQSIPNPPPHPGICFCGKPEKGRIVKCAEINCCTKLFHYPCVGLRRKPKSVNWYCPVCVCMSSVVPT